MRHHGNPTNSACNCSWLIATCDPRSGTRPDEPSLVQSARTQPDAEAVMHEHLDAVVAPIDE